MLNRPNIHSAFSMTPDGSLNKLLVNVAQLSKKDPLRSNTDLTAFELVSRQAFIELLEAVHHPLKKDLRRFLIHFNNENPQDHRVLSMYARRFACVIQTARSGDRWRQGNSHQVALADYWNHIQTLVISGGLTSAQFGIHLATRVESLLDDLEVIASPWAGLTALYGLAQTVASYDNLLVLDFGATAVKRGIAHKFGNRIELLPDINVAGYKSDSVIEDDGFIAILKQTRKDVGRSMPVAISVACYLDNGHPCEYKSGIYHRLGANCPHLETALNDSWLPHSGFTQLALLQHDSTAAALAFRFRHKAMMVTLGTGLGSAPCPSV